MFNKRYSKLVPQELLKTGSINVTHCSTSVTQNWFHSVTPNCFCKCYLKLVPQVLLKTGSTDVKLIRKHSLKIDRQTCSTCPRLFLSTKILKL